MAKGSGDAAIRADGLTAGYGHHPAIEDVSFAVPPGSLSAVLGPNGSGKSTLLKVLMGLIRPWQGEVAILGEPSAPARRHIGYVPQSQEIDWNYPVTVHEVVAMGLYDRSFGPRRFMRRGQERVKAALAALQLEDLERRQAGELSGGQRRRVLLARALVRDPEVLLLDEPAAGLDVAVEDELDQLLIGLARQGKTVLVATHDIGMVMDHYDLALCLDRRVIAFGPAAETLTDDVLHKTFGRQLFAFHGPHHDHVVEFHDTEGRRE